MRLTEDMQRVVLEQGLGFVATVTADGRPDLSPKRIRSIVVIDVSEASQLLPPAHADGASEREIAAMWRQRHGDRRR